jgi:hypothetical protein
MGVLLATGVASILPDYGSATGAATLIPQSIYWNESLNRILATQSGNVAMLGKTDFHRNEQGGIDRSEQVLVVYLPSRSPRFMVDFRSCYG